MISFPQLGIERETLSFLLVGVGGQGTILASNLLAELGIALGYDVKKAEVHGMSQRGGSVISHLRWGSQVHSPIISKGEADIIVAFEKLEALRFVDQIRPDGVILVNDYVIVPVTVSSGMAVYPGDESIRETINSYTHRNYWIKGVEIAEALGNVKVSNVVILGALSALMGMDPEKWLSVVASRVPIKYLDLNRTAFQQGRDAIRIQDYS